MIKMTLRDLINQVTDNDSESDRLLSPVFDYELIVIDDNLNEIEIEGWEKQAQAKRLLLNISNPEYDSLPDLRGDDN
jgi:hypothetical protein